MYDNINRLLVVDSDRDTVDAVRQVAEAMDYSLADANAGNDFLRLVDEFQPTVIVLDMELPDCDGVEALSALAARGCKASILLMGYADRRVMTATREIGARRGLSIAGCITKPLSADELEACLIQLKRQNFSFGSEDIEKGLEAEEFMAFYQPIVSAAPGGGWIVDRLEALVRWQHPKLGIVMPDEFISQMERCGLIGRLTEQMLNQALEQLGSWEQAGFELRCSVNLPPSLVTDLEFPDRIAEAVTSHRVDPGRISFELTETATMQDPVSAMDILTRLRVKGIGLSLDDFGTGYSSLTRLYEMPFEEMKIDRSLGMNVPGSREANTIIGSLIELAHNLGLKVCTEGIESRAALDLLEALNSDRCQGFYVSRALPPAEITSFVEDWNSQSPASAMMRQDHAVASGAG